MERSGNANWMTVSESGTLALLMNGWNMSKVEISFLLGVNVSESQSILQAIWLNVPVSMK